MDCHCWSTLPHEIIHHILSFLPAKSVGQCRCVSRSWRAFLSSPNFIKTHTALVRQFPPQSESFFTHPPVFKCLTVTDSRLAGGDITATFMYFHFVGPPYSYFFSSCDGLVLAGNEKRGKFLINPTTREVKALQFEALVALIGLGYDLVHDDYKVVAICYDFVVYVYSVSNGTWKQYETLMPDLEFFAVPRRPRYDNRDPNNNCNIRSGIFVQNRLHWIDKRKSDKSVVIAAFDVAEEKFLELPLPVNCFVQSNKLSRLHLKVLAGCLCIYGDTFVLWMMKKYGVEESWMEVVSFDPEVSRFEPLCFLGMEDLALMRYYCPYPLEGGLVTYNLKTKTFRYVDNGVFGCGSWLSFQETLVSPYPRDYMMG